MINKVSVRFRLYIAIFKDEYRRTTPTSQNILATRNSINCLFFCIFGYHGDSIEVALALKYLLYKLESIEISVPNALPYRVNDS